MIFETLKYSFILEYNILAENKIPIDFGTKLITTRLDALIKLVEEIVIPAMNETLLTNYLRYLNSWLYLVRGSEVLMITSTLLSHAVIVINCVDFVLIKLMNVLDEPWLLPAHFCVAFCEQIHIDEILDNYEFNGNIKLITVTWEDKSQANPISKRNVLNNSNRQAM